MINHGVIEGRKDSDYVAGVLPYFVRLETANWEPFAPPGERQSNSIADSQSCVSFSAINTIETQERFLTGTAPNYSDRWIAKMSGTTIQGNRLDKVMDTIREFGLVLESDYPAPPEPWTFNQYMAPIPEPLLTQLKAKGQEWKTRWATAYEWVDVSGIYSGNYLNIIKQLKQAPLQIIIPGHAQEQVRNLTAVMRVLDTYVPFLKNENQDSITNALKILLTPLKGQTMSNSVLLKHPNGTYGWWNPAINPSGLISDGLHHGVEVPKNPDGSVNFTALEVIVGGTIVPKP